MRLLLIISILLVSCADKQCDMCKQYDWGFKYGVNAVTRAADKIKVDTTGQNVNLSKIDSVALEVDNCLFKEFPSGILSEKVMKQADCHSGPNIKAIDHSCITVKVPDDWVWSCDGTMQLLKDIAPQDGCLSKGLSVDPDCPCKWRAGVQGDSIIIITPDLYLYKDPLVKILTGCWNPWGSKRLSKCM